VINYDDTITAIATPPGRGAIGIIRVSGNDALAIVDSVFIPCRGKNLAGRKSHTLTFGKIKNDQITVDEVLIGLMIGSSSFSGEDTVEIYCHGGKVILQQVLDLIVKNGARLAKPGEFTRRAFVNGKIDLTQAEAVSDLINAPTELARRGAVLQLEGKLRQPLDKIREELINILADLEAEIDFPDDIEDSSDERQKLIDRLNIICEKTSCLLKNADAGRILHDGFQIAITGKPNAGKSSLLNRLAKEERALVTDIPGTTRDTLEVDVNIEGFPVRFIDTAGLRSARGKVEQHGINRTKKTIDSSDMVIWVSDISKNIPKKDNILPDEIKDKGEIIWVWNKCDLPHKPTKTFIKKLEGLCPQVNICALNGEGISSLHNLIAEKLNKKKNLADDDVVLLRVRHINLLEKVLYLINNSLKSLGTNALTELIVMDIRDSLKAIGEITGDVTTEDLLDKIFSDFCIGK